jgi:hypothetical protein
LKGVKKITEEEYENGVGTGAWISFFQIIYNRFKSTSDPDEQMIYAYLLGGYEYLKPNCETWYDHAWNEIRVFNPF